MGPIRGAFRARHIGDSKTWGRNCQFDAEIKEEQDYVGSRIYLNDSKPRMKDGVMHERRPKCSHLLIRSPSVQKDGSNPDSVRLQEAVMSKHDELTVALDGKPSRREASH